ncbi:hypothetical protein K458DRAFT_27537 [Lentithecium fluviatile CBS 122367]|uniref:Uncharacterized protein n=1 Tax=Lentithecium fluviatile CBS 122367 TaxID=1168545 RepID=A0A6G1J3P6_9PLEO|nr:hypothetical protein K458DRAFT_27537 [Lentithecium fluviatile CBS 122367]
MCRHVIRMVITGLGRTLCHPTAFLARSSTWLVPNRAFSPQQAQRYEFCAHLAPNQKRGVLDCIYASHSGLTVVTVYYILGAVALSYFALSCSPRSRIIPPIIIRPIVTCLHSGIWLCMIGDPDCFRPPERSPVMPFLTATYPSSSLKLTN